MSQFRKYFVAEFRLKGMSIPMIHIIKPGFADHDFNWEYFEVVEYSALEAAQKEITELKSIFSVQLDILEQNKNLTAALKVAEDALRLIASPDENEPNWFHLTSRKALSEIEKIKKGLG